MKINLEQISIRDIFDKYSNKDEEGVVGYHGKLNIRPKYQREFVYDQKKQDAVVRSIWNDYPLNVMYWSDNGDGTYELMDGQQRTLSICKYLKDEYSVDFRYKHNLSKDELDKFLDYKLQVYVCNGTADEKLAWFKIINIAGEPLKEQELRNASYTGPWLLDAKKNFSKSTCPAYNLAKDYINGSPIRQDYLEKVLSWKSKGHIEEYMALHQNDKDANELWSYFQKIIAWIKITFPTYRKEMKSVEWGPLYDAHKNDELNSSELEKKITELMQDEDVTKKSGIYNYVLSGSERALSIRAFTQNQKREAYEKQSGICPVCGKHFEINEMEADHITPWSLGGKTVSENCQMLCKDCNRKKSGI